MTALKPQDTSKHETRTEKPSVLFVAPQPFFANRGTPINVRAMVTRLADLGFDVHLMVFPIGEDLQIPGVSIHRSPRVPFVTRVPIGASWRKFFFDVFMLLRTAVFMVRNKIDVLHGIEEGAMMVGFLGRLTGTPYVCDLDSCIIEQLQRTRLCRWRRSITLIQATENFFARRAAAIVTVCSALTQKAQRIAPNVPVYQLEDYPVDSASEVNREVVAEIRSQFNLNQKKVILYTGNFEPYQGIDLLLESFAILDSDSAVLLLVGGGEGRARYEARAAELKISDRARFAGFRPMEEMGSFMALSDVLASPRIDGTNTPLKVYSYMAAGRAIVATSIDSHTQVLNDESAYLAPPTPRAFSEALNAALEDNREAQSKRLAMIQTARELVEERYSKKHFENKLAELYEFLFQAFPKTEQEAPALRRISGAGL